MEIPTTSARHSILTEAADSHRGQLLTRFAVVTTADGLEQIHKGHVRWDSGQVARWNRDATGSRSILKSGVAKLSLPKQDVIDVLSRHVPAGLDALLARDDVEEDGRRSLVVKTQSSAVLRTLADRLIDLAVQVRASSAPQVDEEPDHDVQQVLLRASQALVLASELDAFPREGS